VEVAAADELDQLRLPVVAEPRRDRERGGHPAQPLLPRAVPGEVQLDAVGVARPPYGPDQHVLALLGREAADREDPERLARAAHRGRSRPEAVEPFRILTR